MKFLIDNQLPITLVTYLQEKGCDAVHVIGIGLDTASDKEIWNYALNHSYIIVTKDEDFFHLATKDQNSVQVVWIRIGNCRTQALISSLNSIWDRIVESLKSDERIIEVR